jgi:hypothetical protein
MWSRSSYRIEGKQKSGSVLCGKKQFHSIRIYGDGCKTSIIVNLAACQAVSAVNQAYLERLPRIVLGRGSRSIIACKIAARLGQTTRRYVRLHGAQNALSRENWCAHKDEKLPTKSSKRSHIAYETCNNTHNYCLAS